MEGEIHQFAHATVEDHIDSPVEPVVNWQIPAIGDRSLTPEEARELADFIESVAGGSEWMQFILCGNQPGVVADRLREEASRAEDMVERYNEAIDNR